MSVAVLGARRPREVEHGVEPGADPAAPRATAPSVRSSRSTSRRAASRTLSGRSAASIRDAVVVGCPRPHPRRAPCGWRRAVGAGGTRAGSCPSSSRTSSRIFSVTSSSARWARAHSTSRIEPFRRVGRLEQLDLLRRPPATRRSPAASASSLGSFIRCTASMTCQRAALVRIEMRTDLYSAASSRVRVVGRRDVEDGRLDPQGRAGTVDAGADAGASGRAEHDCGFAARQAADLGDLGDGADRRRTCRRGGVRREPAGLRRPGRCRRECRVTVWCLVRLARRAGRRRRQPGVRRRAPRARPCREGRRCWPGRAAEVSAWSCPGQPITRLHAFPRRPRKLSTGQPGSPR